MSEKLKNALAKKIIRLTDENLDDEQMIHALLAEEIFIGDEDEEVSFGDRAADFLAKFAGSWQFIISFCLFLLGWIVANLYFLHNSFDPYPFILLNLILSCLASVQAPLIMMSQNRQEEKDRKRLECDCRINLKSQIIVEDIHYKLDRIIENQQKILNKSENNVSEVEKRR